MAGSMRNIKEKKLYLQVYQEIQEYIVTNQLKAGDKLPTEMEMSTNLGVSRNVLREALKCLELNGIIHSRPGVGMVICEFNMDSFFKNNFYYYARSNSDLLHQSVEVRRVLELGFAEQAFATITPEQIETLRTCCQQLRSYYKAALQTANQRLTFGVQFRDEDAFFHATMFERVENLPLRSITRSIWFCDYYCETAVTAEDIRDTVEKHENIVKALENHDYNAFLVAIHDHFERFYKLGGQK